MIITILYSLLATTIFGLIDGGFFFLVEKELKKRLNKLKFLDSNTIPIVFGMFAASIAIFASTFIRIHIKKRVYILEYPIIDAVGIILGNCIVIALYYIFKNNNFIKKFLNKFKKKKEDK